jgi:hypothetical protein
VTPAGLRQAQAEDPILNGRPFSAVGPPITIYEPIFSTFRAMNEGKICVEVSLKDNALVKALLVALSGIHNTERFRQNAISEPLERLLGDVFFTTQLDDATSNGGEIHKTSGENAYLLLLREIKNEAGTGDPSLQAGYAYSRWWSSRLVRIFGTALSRTLTLSRGITFVSEHAAPAFFSPSRGPGFACKEPSLLASHGPSNH